MAASKEPQEPLDKNLSIASICASEKPTGDGQLERPPAAGTPTVVITPVPASIPEFKEGDLIAEHFKLGRILGRGGFGVVYETTDKRSGKTHAIKIELRKPRVDEPGVSLEIGVLKRLQNSSHFTKLIASGKHGELTFLVMQMVGQNLNNLRKRCPESKFSLSTAIRASLQCFQALVDLHNVGLLHRDVKPHNYCIGLKHPETRLIYLLDFGLVRMYKLKDGRVRPARPRTAFRGTPKYASYNIMTNHDAGRQDDLMSWIYLFVEAIKGELPWSHELDRQKMARMKISTKSQLFASTFAELVHIYDSIMNLKSHDTPPYHFYRHEIDSLMHKHRIIMSDPFDWEPDGPFYAFIKEGATAPSPSTTHPTGPLVKIEYDKREIEDQTGYTNEKTETEAPGDH